VLNFNPTAENLAAYLLNTAVGLFGGNMVHAVEVKETEGTNAVAYR
jgi:hypothetical protein